LSVLPVLVTWQAFAAHGWTSGTPASLWSPEPSSCWTRGGLSVLGLRFSADRGCPAERFQMLRRELGEGFEAIEVDSSPGNPYGIPTRAHAVLTVDLVDAPGHPTRAALDRVLGFLDQRLHR
jgi:hypothetical protein